MGSRRDLRDMGSLRELTFEETVLPPLTPLDPFPAGLSLQLCHFASV